MVRRTLIGVLTFIAATMVFAASASATVPPQGKVGPNQFFAALVNGQSGVATPATINMACFGPVKPGQMGHPMAGQTVEVLRPEVILTDDGYTGSQATSITAFFGPPPPSSVATAPKTSTVTFRRYGVAKKIPTSLLLPCGGTGTVYFVPLPMSPPTSQPATIPVSYVGQP
jgi:hypothetical protein